MSKNTIDASLCARMFLAGAGNLEHKKDWINELNVFPVPDGDTGTNMSMTIMSAVREVNALEQLDMAALCKAMSSGSLRGARGNSGVILSQLLRGFCKGIRDYEEVDVEIVCAAFQKAVETAYKAVMKPKEGTILTVAAGFAKKAAQIQEKDPQVSMEDLLGGALEHARDVLEQTPEMLPVLKEAGVVDSGGQGLVEILSGAYDLFCGKEVDHFIKREEEKPLPYCVELLIKPGSSYTEEMERQFAKDIKDVCIKDETVILVDDGNVKIHVHTMDPGAIISRAVADGLIRHVKIENLKDGHREKLVKKEDRVKAKAIAMERLEKAQPRKKTGFVSVCPGDGLGKIMMDLGVDVVIQGGQTMNPSTDDMLHAFERVNAETVFVFPNNKNIILAASQAGELCTDKKVKVIPTATVPQGICAMISYMPDMSDDENEQEMKEAAGLVRTCQVTYAVRDTKIDDVQIHEGDYMCVGDSGILSSGGDMDEIILSAVTAMVDDSSELISLYYGDETSREQADALAGKLSEGFPGCEVEVNSGGQPVYYYIISVE